MFAGAKILALFTLIHVVTVSCDDIHASNSNWNLIAVGPWAARQGVIGAVLNDYVYISGGRQDTTFFNDVYRMSGDCITSSSSFTSANNTFTYTYTNSKCQWELVTDNAPWYARGYHAMVTHASYLYIIAGQNYTSYLNDIWRSKDGSVWELVLSNKYINISDVNSNSSNIKQFEQRSTLGCVSYNNERLYCMAGGQGNPPNRIEFNDVWYSNDNGQTWDILIVESQWKARGGSRVSINNDIIYLTGGEFFFSRETQFDDVWRLDINGDNNGSYYWECVTKEAQWSKRSGHGFVIDSKNNLWIMAGYFDKHDLWMSGDNGSNWNNIRNDVFNCSDYESESIASGIIIKEKKDNYYSETRISSGLCGRFDFGAVLYKDYVVLFGGDDDYTSVGGENNQTWVLQLS